MPTNYGGLNNRPLAPVYNPGLASSFYANPANRGKKVSELWRTMPTFSSWDEAARGDFGSSNPAFANLTDDGRSNLLRDVYGLSSDYRVANGALVRAKPRQGLVAALTLGSMVAPNLIGMMGAGGGAGAGATAAATGAGSEAAWLAGLAAPATATGAGGGMTLGSILSSPLLSTGLQAGFGAYGARQQRKGLDAQLALEMQRDQQAQRQWEAQQAFQQQQFAAQEEDRAFTRQEAERRIRLEQEREQRQAPYRAASQAALGRLGAILGLRI